MNSPLSIPPIIERYPALKRLWSVRARIPFVPQLNSLECGLASLAMVLGYHGRATTLDELRSLVLLQPGSGTSAQSLLDVGRSLGLRGRGVTIEISDLAQVEPGTILHWNFNHYVVLEEYASEGITVVDPSMGRRHVPLGEVQTAFTGVALLFSPSENFVRRIKSGSGPRLGRQVRELFRLRAWARVVVTSLLLQIFALAMPGLTALVVDRVVPTGDRNLLFVAIAGVFIVVVFQYLTQLVRGHLLLSIRRHLDVQLHAGYMDHIVSLPFRFFQERSSGDLVARYISNASIQTALTSASMTILVDGLMVILFLLLLLILEPSMGLVVLCFALIQILVVAVPFGTQRDLASQGLVSSGRTLAAASEILQAAETLKLLGAEQRAVRVWTNKLIESLKLEFERARISVHQESLLASVRFAAPVAVLGLGAKLVIGGSLSLGTMLSAAALAGAFLGPLSSLLSTVLATANVESHLARIEDVLSSTPEQGGTAARVIPALRGRIDVEGVSFRYGPLSPKVLSNVSFSVTPGQFVALVGPSGSGKSTFASLLLGLNLAQEGCIFFDGLSLPELDFTALRRQVGIVPQRPYIFSQSIRHNIAAGDAGMEMRTIVEAARLACVHDEILALPQGYDTELSEGGSSLSGGQRQRIAIARALARNPKVLVLDEATSALDGIVEREVQSNLDNLGCTRIVIAHRLSTVRHADLIAVFDRGTIVQRGTHEDLSQVQGLYQRLLGGGF